MPQQQETLDLDLQLTPQGSTAQGKIYAARVLTSPAGQASGAFQAPFTVADTTEFIQEIMPSARPMSRLALQAMMKEHGGRLFDTLFQDDLLVCLERSFDEARRRNATLRIKLRLHDTPELLNLPWEYLYHRRRNLFLSQSTTSSLVYFLELPDPVASLTITLPLRMLVVIASPADLPQLDAEREWQNIQHALTELIERGMVIIDRLPQATLPELQSALRRHDYHIFHFIGHVDLDENGGHGNLILVDAQGQAAPMPGEVLAQLLHNERTLRLAVLNACEGSPTAGENLFAGVAQQLVQQGVPAVIAMRQPISDEAAMTFSQEFYAALADGYSVDGAITEARVAVATRLGNGEWGTPQLIMHAHNGMLWQVAAKVDDAVIDGAAIGADLGVLAQLMQRSAVRERVAAYRADFTAAEREIDILSNYKFLHDLLHKLQFRCYNVITQEARRFPSDELAFDNLLNYEVTLQDIVANLQGVMEEAQFPQNETLWVNDLLDAQQLLRRALDTMESEALRRVVWLMRRVLALQPSTVNHRLSSAARALRLETIVASLRAIRQELGDVQVADPQLTQLDSGVHELE
ncbi:MAG: CHAT domain-containing protein, partial [Caldilineaceae bacterium]|nr:CHAT domain-containing protein [Caldilineaceae bacterium]